MKDIAALKLYTRVARLGSFSAAGRESGMSQPQVSRMIAELEQELGARLLSRTTRAVVPTEAGKAFLLRIEAILAALDEAGQSVREGGEFHGMLRLSMPTSFGIHVAIPRLADFAARHSRLQIHLELDDRRQDLVREAVDVAIRIGTLPDSASATARQIALVSRVIVASPAYLAANGAPARPEDLAGHRIIGGAAATNPLAWTFERDGERIAARVQPQFTTNENEGAIVAAIAGLGITSTGEWECRRALEDGSLVRLLTDWTMADVPVHAYFPMGRNTRAAARALIDHLRDGIAADGRG